MKAIFLIASSDVLETTFSVLEDVEPPKMVRKSVNLLFVLILSQPEIIDKLL